ncbi:MAG: hypothetical protein PHI79_07070 [Sulfurovaceae bacterium]|nr:hypothetical protein [Sulfurovaceae bacterium]MDD5549338.1 hypothetical protein [Sulfurovaceae bacterium]
MSNETENQDFRMAGIEVTTKYNKDIILSEIRDIGRPTGREVLYAKAINLADEEIRKALIELGWTQPKVNENNKVKKNRELKALELYEKDNTHCQLYSGLFLADDAIKELKQELGKLQNRDKWLLEICNDALGTGAKGHSLAIMTIIKALKEHI